MVFSILFGLSCDYQVFLVSRMHEEWVNTGDNRKAVRRGLAGSGKVVAMAAAIMTSVFAAFILGIDPIVKLFGVALSTAVLLDAFVVRLVLVPVADDHLRQGELVAARAGSRGSCRTSASSPSTTSRPALPRSSTSANRARNANPSASDARSARRSAHRSTLVVWLCHGAPRLTCARVVSTVRVHSIVSTREKRCHQKDTWLAPQSVALR